ncbi:helix-turn-helix transcriptional regulator [Epilithonimonas caeni]|uniref:helix-turn-helix transcriptional regulator n=1 Tax=Epilithonimonas caeni TaxID=365343 RepID=UPI00040A95DD|nr:LuxR C-terminal-related transcriptional regulator [Epilithonimonas caeni]
MKWISVIIILFFGVIVSAQQTYQKKIDEYLKVSNDAYINFEDLKSLQYGLKANELASKINNSRSIAISYYYISRASSTLGMYENGLKYAEKALSEKFTQTNIDLKLRLLEIKANNSHDLRLYDKSRKLSREIISVINESNKDSDILYVKLLSSSYGNIGSTYYYELNSLDSLKKYTAIEMALLKKLPEKDAYERLSVAYISQGDNYLKAKKYDSAFYYYQESRRVSTQYQANFPLYDYYAAMGRFYLNSQQVEKSLENFLHAEKELVQFPQESNALMDVYKEISGLYGKLGDKKREKEYLLEYLRKNEEISEKNEKNINYALNLIQQEKHVQTIIFTKRFHQMLMASFVLLSILILYYFFEKRNKKRADYRTKQLLEEKESIIHEKGKEAQILQQKVNESFEEIVLLAKKNNPHFWTRFQEVYPGFREKLLEKHPKFRSSELTLCAYIFLGFSNKEIADYTFKSVRTIESNRYNIRKKLELPTHLDFSVWLRSLVEGQ